MTELIISNGRGELARHRLASGMTVGRAEQCNVVVDETMASRRHCRFHADAGEWVLEDLRSSNGTYVNGRRIADRHKLRDDDEVQIGTLTLRLQSAQATDAAADDDDVVANHVDRQLASSAPADPATVLVQPAASTATETTEPTLTGANFRRWQQRLWDDGGAHQAGNGTRATAAGSRFDLTATAGRAAAPAADASFLRNNRLKLAFAVVAIVVCLWQLSGLFQSNYSGLSDTAIARDIKVQLPD